MTVPEEFIERFGSPAYFKDFFRGIEYPDMNKEFSKLDNSKDKASEQYEATRQHFLKLLGRNRMIWHPTKRNFDLNVDISRIYRRDQSDFVAFMRIKPRGFRSERAVPQDTKMVFHLIYGNVVFNTRKKSGAMKKGSYRIVPPRSSYSIRCVGEETAYFIFRVVKFKTSKRDNYGRIVEDLTIDE